MSGPLPGTAPQGPLLPAGSPRIAGIVNLTEDSFPDGGRCPSPAAAVAHARHLRAAGAGITGLGPAASHPDPAPASAALQAAGTGRDPLVTGPGPGCFPGSAPGPWPAAPAGIRALKAASGVPVLVSPSRKSFLAAVTREASRA
jgi:dihydropteroate synthase